MKRLNADVVTPLYAQIYQDIVQRIDSGEYMPGDKLPTESEMEAQYGVSRVTVRNALNRLVDEHLLVKRAGKGTFVPMPPFIASTPLESSFTKSCMLHNAVPGTILISKKIVSAKRAVAEGLGIEQNARIICVKRLRLVNSVASIFEVDYFRTDFDFMLYADVETTPLLEVIRNVTGKLGKKNRAVIEVKYADKEQARYLECSFGEALLGVSQTVMTEEQEILYYNEQYIRSDRYKYVVGD